MRLLFVSSTTVGGSGRSQRELARHLVSRGHHVTFLVDDGSPARVRRFVYEQLSDASARLEGHVGSAGVRILERRPGRRVRRLDLDGLTHLATPVPENALEPILRMFEPDVVVGNSLTRPCWRRVQRICSRTGTATLLYVREVASLDHFLTDRPTAVVANSLSLVEAVRQRGVNCSFVPSLIDVEPTRTVSTRRVALMVNPRPSHGIELVWELARRMPDVRFVIQESWPLTDQQASEVEGRCADLANTEFRRSRPPGPDLYGDARVLLVPHLLDDRPRVVAEAQANGIPVIAADTPGLIEAVGDGGVLVDATDVDRWYDEICSLWSDARRYDDLVRHAVAHSRRPEIDPDVVTRRFEEVAIETLRLRAG